MYYRRKIDAFLQEWKADPNHKPLIVKGARQIGKTESILHFAKNQTLLFTLQRRILLFFLTRYRKTRMWPLR